MTTAKALPFRLREKVNLSAKATLILIEPA
jgi:hypothetical protein